MNERNALYPLRYASHEVEVLKEIFGRSSVTESFSTKDRWRTLIRQCNIFHYTGHARSTSAEAFLALSTKHEDRLTDEEIMIFQCPISMVVLSACETGLGEYAYGEGIKSLSRSFIHAGASSSIYSLWTVNDKSTAIIMRNFYTYLKQGFQKHKALRQAKLDYYQAANATNRHPYFWAGFVPAGDMSPIHNPPGRHIWMSMVLFAIILFFKFPRLL